MLKPFVFLTLNFVMISFTNSISVSLALALYPDQTLLFRWTPYLQLFVTVKTFVLLYFSKEILGYYMQLIVIEEWLGNGRGVAHVYLNIWSEVLYWRNLLWKQKWTSVLLFSIIIVYRFVSSLDSLHLLLPSLPWWCLLWWLSHGLENLQNLAGARNFSLLQSVSMSSGAHPVFCVLYTVVLFYWANSTGPWIWPLTSV